MAGRRGIEPRTPGFGNPADAQIATRAVPPEGVEPSAVSVRSAASRPRGGGIRPRGIEPPSPAGHAGALPLSYGRLASLPGIGPGSPVRDTGALGHYATGTEIEPHGGVEPQLFPVTKRVLLPGSDAGQSGSRDLHPHERGGSPTCCCYIRAAITLSGRIRTSGVPDPSRGVYELVSRAGIEPASGRGKNPLQGQRLLPARREDGAAPWNRTRSPVLQTGARTTYARAAQAAPPSSRERGADLSPGTSSDVPRLFDCHRRRCWFRPQHSALRRR